MADEPLHDILSLEEELRRWRSAEEERLRAARDALGHELAQAYEDEVERLAAVRLTAVAAARAAAEAAAAALTAAAAESGARLAAITDQLLLSVLRDHLPALLAGGDDDHPHDQG